MSYLINTLLCLLIHYWTQMKFFCQLLLEFMVHWIIALQLIILPFSLELKCTSLTHWLWTWSCGVRGPIEWVEVTAGRFWEEASVGLASFFQLPCTSAIYHKNSLSQVITAPSEWVPEWNVSKSELNLTHNLKQRKKSAFSVSHWHLWSCLLHNIDSAIAMHT